MTQDSQNEPTTCVECGKDLTDPKNRGDPIDGEWVCESDVCRAVHDVRNVEVA